MLRFPVRPMSLQKLQQAATPGAVSGGQAEALPWIFFDTATYVSGTTTQLPFFTTARATRQLSNLDTPGVIPEPQYFKIEFFGLDLLISPANGAWDDAHQLLMGEGTAANGGPTWEFILADKSYGTFPLTFLHESGGQRGSALTPTTGAQLEYARNAFPDGGWAVDGSIIVPPQQGFRVDVRWPAALTLAGGDTALRLWMAGSIYRRVL